MLNNLQQISDLMQGVNEYLSSPACSNELTRLSKHYQQHKNLQKDMEQAGRLQKRGLKKQLEDLHNLIIETEETCLKCIFDRIIQDIKPNLESQKRLLSTVSPQAATFIQNLRFPLTSEINALASFINEFNKVQNTIASNLRRVCNSLLQENKSNVNLYSNLVTLDSNSIQRTITLTENALNVMRLEDLLEAISALKNESEIINQKLASSTEIVQQKLLQSTHELLSSIQEGTKRKTIPEFSEYQVVQQLLLQIERANTIGELNQINSTLSNYVSKFNSSIKSEITRSHTLGKNIIIQTRNMFPTLSDKWMPPPPEFQISGASIPEMINFLDQMINWKNKILECMKRIATLDEMNQVAEGALYEGITIPNTLLVNAKESASQIQEVTTDIEVAFKKLQNFHIFYSKYLDIIRENIRANLSFEATDTDSSALIAIKPPVINLESDSPSELLGYLRAVIVWKRKLINVLQEARHAINDTIATINQLEKKGITNFPSDFQSEFTTLYEKMASETDVQTLLLYRRSYDRLYKQFVNLTAAYIKDYLKDVIILQLLDSEPNIPRPPFIEDVTELDLSELLARIETIEEWKKEVLIFLKNEVEALKFPLIPGEVPIDLREEKTNLITQLTGTAASRNSIATFNSYLEFKQTIVSSKNLMIEETLNQIKLIEKIDKASMRYFSTVIGSAPIFEIPSDLEPLEFSELLELWFRLNTYNNKRIELVQLKCREVLSGWAKQYKSLPSHHLNIFNSLFLIFDQALNDLSQSLDVETTLDKYEFFLNSATDKAQEGLEKLKSLFYNKVTVSLPRITEVMGEVSPEIRKVYSFLESTISAKDQTLESIHRLIVETIHDYEYVLLAKLMELLSIASKNLLRRISELQACGINLQILVGEQIEIFSQLIQADSSDMMSVEMITQSFVELDKIIKNENLQKSLFDIIESKHTVAGRILDLVQALGWKNASQSLMPSVVRIRQARNAIQFWSFELIAKSTIESINASKELLEALRVLENQNYEIYINELENDPNIPYYKSIQTVFEFQLDKCSNEIFPLKELIALREQLQAENELSDIYDILTKISKFKTQWQKEYLPLISKWHRVLFLFISDYIPTRVKEEKITFLANTKREIEDTYNYNPMIQYLTSAVELYVSNK